MIDLEKVDALFEASRVSGIPVQFRLFDRGVLLPVGRLREAVAGETEETISDEQLIVKAGEGWFSILRWSSETSVYEGVPFYVPSR